MSDSRLFSSYSAEAELAIGAPDLVALDEGEKRRTQVEQLATSDEPEATLAIIEFLGDTDWRVRKTAVAALANQPDIDPAVLLCELLASEDAGERNAAIKALIKRGSESLPYLLEQLDQPDPDVRNLACIALGHIGDKSATRRLLKMLDSEEDLNVRYVVVEALGRIGDRDAIPRLIDMLEEDVWFAAPAAEALGAIGGAKALNALMSHLADDALGLICVEALGGLGDARALMPLLRTAAEVDLVLGVPIVCAIGRILLQSDSDGHKIPDILQRHCGSITSPPLIEAVRTALARSGEVRELAMRVAAWLGDPDLAAAVCLATETPEHAPLAANYLARNLDDLNEHLVYGVRSPFPSIRIAIAEAVAHHGSPDHVPLLLQILYDQNQAVCLAAIEALSSIGGPAESHHLLPLLSSDSVEVRDAAAHNLGVLGLERIEDELIDLAADPSPVTREAIARTLGWRSTDPESTRLCECLISLARDPDSRVRATVGPALATTNCADALSALLMLTADENIEVRLGALRSLSHRNSPAAKRVLRTHLTDDMPALRLAAVRGLSSPALAEDIPLLLSLLEDPDPGIVLAALAGVSTSGAPEASRAIVRLIEHPSDDVREAALRSLCGESPETACKLSAVVLSGPESAWNVRVAAVDSLNRCESGPWARELVEQALKDPDLVVRQAAVAAVPSVFDEDAATRLISLLEDDSLEEHARKTLISMGHPAIAALNEALSTDISAQARRSIALVLGSTEAENACACVTGMLFDGDEEDRWHAVLAITDCGCRPLLPGLEELAAEEPDETVAAVLSYLAGGGCR